MLGRTRFAFVSMLLSALAGAGCDGGADPEAPDGSVTGGTGGAGGDAAGAGGAGGGGSTTGAGGGACASELAEGVSVGTAADDEALDVALDAAGNVYVTGYEGGTTGVTNVQPAGDARAVVLKYSPAGQLLWRSELNTPGTETGEAIAVHPTTGDVYVAGRTTGALGATANQGQFDLFLAVLSADGETRTIFQSGRERPEHPARLAFGTEGRVVIAGYDDIYIPSNFVAALDDGFSLELDVDPSAEIAVVERGWKRADTPAPDRLTSVAVDGGGATYVAGFEDGNGAFLEKLDEDGARVWLRSGNELGLHPTVVALSPAGKLHVAGAILVAESGMAAAVAELDADTGLPRWGVTVPSNGFASSTGLAFDGAGDVYVAGATTGTVEPGVTNAGESDVFVMRLHDGRVTAVRQLGTPGDDQVKSLAVDPCGRAFLAGYSEGELIQGNGHVAGRDLFLLPIDL